MRRPSSRGLSLFDVMRAQARVEAHLGPTPLLPSGSLSELAGHQVLLKAENQQLTGSFKLRGALNAVLSLNDDGRERGVVTVSTGNHGRAVAHACRELGIKAVVCVSELVPANKLAAIRDLGAELVIGGAGQDEAEAVAKKLMAEQGLTLIPPFDHPDVIAGQGTLGLEIARQLARTPEGQRGRLRVLVPLSGGGLLSGVALALRAVSPDVHVVAVSSRSCCAMYRSLERGQPVEVEEKASLADSLGGGIGVHNAYTFELVRELTNEHVLVDEEQIAGAVAHAYLQERQIVEGGGAVGIAALLSGAAGKPERAKAEDQPQEFGATVIILSGGNIDMELHARLAAEASGSRVARETTTSTARAAGPPRRVTGGTRHA